MAEREVLKRDVGRTGQESAQKGPETDRENHRGPPHQAWHLCRHSTGAGVAMVREFQAGRADGLLDRDTGSLLASEPAEGCRAAADGKVRESGRRATGGFSCLRWHAWGYGKTPARARRRRPYIAGWRQVASVKRVGRRVLLQR
jgi:hypothetical protein